MKRLWVILLFVTLALCLCVYVVNSHRTTHTAATNTTTTTATSPSSTTTTTATATSTATTTTTTTTTATSTATTTTTTTKRPQPTKEVVNIALFGIDQAEGAVGRCDTSIILSINYTDNTLKLTSLARDSLVPIAGHGEEKLTHAWAYGGAALALDTINNAFGTDLTDYIYVNFADFATLVDLLGGVNITVNEIELAAINYTTNEADKLPGTGRHRLNGTQALRYVRCRTDGDTQRTARQRTLLKAILEETKDLSAAQIPGLLLNLRDVYHTSLSNVEMIKILSWIALQSPSWEEMSLPDSRLNAWSGTLDRTRGWVYVYDLDYAAALLYDFIYDTDTAADLPKPTKPNIANQ